MRIQLYRLLSKCYLVCFDFHQWNVNIVIWTQVLYVFYTRNSGLRHRHNVHEGQQG